MTRPATTQGARQELTLDTTKPPAPSPQEFLRKWWCSAMLKLALPDAPVIQPCSARPSAGALGPTPLNERARCKDVPRLRGEHLSNPDQVVPDRAISMVVWRAARLPGLPGCREPSFEAQASANSKPSASSSRRVAPVHTSAAGRWSAKGHGGGHPQSTTPMPHHQRRLLSQTATAPGSGAFALRACRPTPAGTSSCRGWVFANADRSAPNHPLKCGLADVAPELTAGSVPGQHRPCRHASIKMATMCASR